MKRTAITLGVLIGVFLVAAPPISRAQADANRVTVEKATTDPSVIEAKVRKKQEEIRAKVAAAMAENEMPMVVTPKIQPKPRITVVAEEPPAPPGPNLEASYKDRLIAAWPGDDGWAIKTTSCESGINPFARNPSGKYLGMWQMDSSFWKSYGGLEFGPDPITRVHPRDQRGLVEEQTLVAWRGYQARGAQPWSCG